MLFTTMVPIYLSGVGYYQLLALTGLHIVPKKGRLGERYNVTLGGHSSMPPLLSVVFII